MYQQWNVGDLLADLLRSFDPLPLLVEHRAMIGEEDDDSVVVEAKTADGVDNLAIPVVDVRGFPGVVGAKSAHALFRNLDVGIG